MRKMGIPFTKRAPEPKENVKQASTVTELEPFVVVKFTTNDNAAPAVEVSFAIVTNRPDVMIKPKRTREPEPYDKHAPRHGVLYADVVPARWSPYASDPTLVDRSDVHAVRCGDHVAHFDPEDAAKVDALFALQSVPEKPSDKKAALIRLRTTMAIAKGTPVSMVYQLEKVARMFHDALEHAPGETVAAADLEACLEAWVLEPTRYAPFPDLSGAVAFMHLPVHDNEVVGMALKHRYDPGPVPLPAVVTSRAVATTNHMLVREPKVTFARVSVWNEPARPTHDNFLGKSSTKILGFE